MRPEETLSRKDICTTGAASGPDNGMLAASTGGKTAPDATETDLIGWDAIEERRERREYQRSEENDLVPAWKSYSQLCQALSRGAHLLKWEAPEKSKLFRKGARHLLDVAKRQSTTVLGAVITLSLLLGAFAPMIEASGLSASDSPPQATSNGIITVNGTNLQLNGSVIHFHGINDQTVIPLNFYPYPQYNYQYHNHLFPKYTDDVNTKLASDNYTDFWFQYFWLCKSIGLNMVRLGAFDAWSLGIIHGMWKYDQASWNRIIDPMLAMAKVNGIYIDWCFGGSNSPATQTFDSVNGGFGDSMTTPMAGNIFAVGTPCFNEYASFIGAVMTKYANESAIAMWDLANEPDHDLIYDRWWSTFGNPQSAYQTWAQSLTTAVRAIDSSHVLTIGAMYNGKLFPWGESHFDIMCGNAATVTDHHMYSSVNADLGEYWISDRKSWSNGLNKPIFISEFGYGEGGIYYYPWAAQRMDANNYAGYCLMALWEYPGYPIPQSVMDSIPAPPSSNTPPPMVNPPSAPSSPIAAAGVGLITLSWSAPTSNGGSAIIGYKVYRASSAGGEGSTPIASLGVTYSWTDSGLAAGSTFYYKITASNSAGEGARSAEVSSTTPTVPSAPMNLAATPLNGQVTITWQAPQSNGGTSITSYSILRSTQSGTETMLTSTSGTSYTDNELINGQAYYYIVKASNAVGIGPASNEASAIPKTVPSAPNSPSAVGAVGSITLSWSAPTSSGGSAITGYKMYRGSSAGNEGTAPVATLGNVYSWTDTGLPSATTYYYCIAANNAAGEGARSAEVSASSAGLPLAPLNLMASATDRMVSLSWQAPSSDGGASISTYTIMRGLAAGQETFLATSTGTSFTDSGLTNGQAYYYKVFATNAVGTGPVSNEASATPAAVPSAPALSSATPGNAQVLLVWIAPSSDGGASITGYKVYRGTTSGGEVLLATLGSVLTYMDASIINGQTYYYRVSAVNSVGESPLSAEVSAKPATVPSSPMSVQISSGNGTNTVSWGTPEDDGGAVIQNYRIYRSTFSNSETYLATCAGTTYTDIGLINGQIYYYKVRAVTSLGEGALSAEVSGRPMTIPTAPTNLQAVNGNGTITLSWSAPANDGGSAIVSYRIFRGLASGAEVLLAETNGTTFLDSGLQNGLAYYYEISATNIVGESGRSAEAQATPGGAPSIPMDLAAFSGNMKLTLSWQSPAYQGGFPINGYNLYRSTVAGQETLLTTLGNVLSYTDSGLSNGITYYYKITAFNAIGEGSLSGEASGRPATIPTEPINFILTPGNRQMLLRWSAPISDGGATVIAYNIYRADASGAEALVVNVTGDLEYLDSGLTNEKTYYYRISAINQMGEGFLSQERSATTNPQFPTNPQNASAEAADGSVQLSWSPPTSDGGSKIIGYKVYRSYIQGGEVLIATLDNVTAFKDEGLVNGVTLFYEITAFNAGREGLPSKRISALPTGVPGTPIGLSTAHGYRNITLTWSAPATDGGVPVTGYRIYRADGSADPVLIANLAITQHSFIDQDLPQGKVYKYQVSAVNLIGEGEPSAEVSLTLPGPPTSPQQLAGTSEDGKVTLSWTAPQSDNLDAVIGYLVYRGTSVTGLEQISMVAGSRMSYVDTGLVNGMTYYYQVTALNSVGEGASSELVSVVPLGVPSAPTELQSDVNGTDATLSWSAPVENGGMPIRGYTISMTVENDKTPINLGDVGTSNLTFVVKGLRLGQGYHFTVTAYNDVGNGTDSITVLVTISGPKASVSVANGQDLLATMPLVPLLILSSAIWLVSVFAIRNRGWLKPKKMEETIKELEKNDTELVQTVKKLEQSNLVTQNSTNEFQKSLRELERLNR